MIVENEYVKFERDTSAYVYGAWIFEGELGDVLRDGFVVFGSVNGVFDAYTLLCLKGNCVFYAYTFWIFFLWKIQFLRVREEDRWFSG